MPSLFVELVICEVLQKLVDHFILYDIQKSAYSIITKNLKTFYEILVHYEKYLVKGAKQTAFAESELFMDPCSSWGDIQNCRITCYVLMPMTMKILRVFAFIILGILCILFSIVGYFIVLEQIDQRAVSKLLYKIPNIELLDIWGGYDVGVGVYLKINNTQTIRLGSVTPKAVDKEGNIWITKFGEYTPQEWWCGKSGDNESKWLGFTDYSSAHEKNSLNGKLLQPIKSVEDLAVRIDEVEKAFFSYPVCPQFIESTSQNGNIVRQCIILGDKAIHQGQDWQSKTKKLCQ